MSPAEMAWRARDQALALAWTRRQLTPAAFAGTGLAGAGLAGTDLAGTDLAGTDLAGGRRFTALLPAGTASRVPQGAKASLLASADRLLRGEWDVLGVARTDLVRPDWFLDPLTGHRSAAERYAFRIDPRSQQQVGNVKQVWEVARLQHLTLLATAWFLSQDEKYADRVAAQLRSWWRENPFLSGVHWTSGIEIGIRLISMTWIRRLLADWPGAPDLFEANPVAVRQIRWHQQYLAAFPSRGSSANNHVIAEAAGQLVASCAFDWFKESPGWRRRSAALLERELIRNTFPSGIGRELASDYQCFVAELGLLAAVESAASGHPLSEASWQRLAAMADSAAALLDQRLRPPRQGDSDEGRAILLDAPQPSRWPAMLSMAGALIGGADWWPALPPDAGGPIVAALLPAALLPADLLPAAGPATRIPGRPARRPWRFPDAGLTLLRSDDDQDTPEIWCRCDGGPHGFLSIAAHAHADALSVEIRHGGVDILADPGTYCYHGEAPWRSYFRSTIAHNTVQIGGQSQSAEGGPFLWTRHADAAETDVSDDGTVASWSAEHRGYQWLDPSAGHRRTVRLDRGSRTISIADEIDGSGHEIRLAFHLGPEVDAELSGSSARLSWPAGSGTGTARLELPSALSWTAHRGETTPILGWYAPGFGRKVPSYSLLGAGSLGAGNGISPLRLITTLHFLDTEVSPQLDQSGHAVSWVGSGGTGPGGAAQIRAEAR